MVTIQQRPTDGGYYFEISDFADYVEALRERGIEPPKAQYRFFVSFDNQRKLCESPNDWRRQIELFYRLGPTTNIPCRFAADAGGDKVTAKGSHG
jgi:hypothetical protein